VINFRMMRWWVTGHVWKRTGMVGELEEKRLCRRLRHRWEDDTKVDLKDIG
jgi:hypothetical protein